MKNIKISKVMVRRLIVGLVCCVIVPLSAMEPMSKKMFKRPRAVQPIQRKQPMRYKTEMVWIKTADDLIIEMPRWYVDQMQVLQVLFVHQKGKNSKNNPIDAGMVTSEQLTLLQMALKNASDLVKLELFCSNLTRDEKHNLINSSFTLDAQGLIALVMNILFSPEIQIKLGASTITPEGVMYPVVQYLQNIVDQKIIFKNRGLVSCVLFSHDGSFIVTGTTGRDNNLIIWDSKSGGKKSDLVGHSLWVQCIAISSQDDFIVSGCSSNVDNLILWNVKTGGKKNLIGHDAWVYCVAFSENGNYILSGSAGNHNNLILWHGTTGEQIKIFDGHDAQVNCAAFSPDGDYIISGSNGDANNLILWNLKMNEKIVLVGHRSSVSCALFSADGNYIISGSEGDHDNLILWNGKTGALIKKLEGHGRNVMCASFSSDGEYIVSGSYENENNLILWNGKTGKQIKILKGHDTGVNCALFSFDGSFIASGAYGLQKNLILWDGKTGRLIRVYEGHEKNVRSIAFHPDGRSLVSGAFCQKNNLIEWSLLHTGVLNFIATQLSIAQARLLYRLYVGKINNVPVVLEKNDPDYHLYLTLPYNVQQLIQSNFSFEIVDVFEKAVQEKMNYYKSLFTKTHATFDEKIKTIKILMKDFEKGSIDYQACERLLRELEQETAFEGV